MVTWREGLTIVNFTKMQSIAFRQKFIKL